MSAKTLQVRGVGVRDEFLTIFLLPIKIAIMVLIQTEKQQNIIPAVKLDKYRENGR